jgi:hypothetical protein
MVGGPDLVKTGLFIAIIIPPIKPGGFTFPGRGPRDKPQASEIERTEARRCPAYRSQSDQLGSKYAIRLLTNSLDFGGERSVTVLQN